MDKKNKIMEEEKDNSMTGIAYMILKDQTEPLFFYDLWQKVKDVLKANFSEEELNAQISNFYTGITLDGRFINVGENKWEIREKVPFDKVHIDMNDVYAEDEEIEEVDDEDEDASEIVYGNEDDEEQSGDSDADDKDLYKDDFFSDIDE